MLPTDDLCYNVTDDGYRSKVHIFIWYDTTDAV